MMRNRALVCVLKNTRTFLNDDQKYTCVRVNTEDFEGELFPTITLTHLNSDVPFKRHACRFSAFILFTSQ